MIPIFAIVGRPNVGKSTLFNRLTQSRKALVAEVSGLTRDRNYGKSTYGGRECILIDTGGIGQEQTKLDYKVNEQTLVAMHEADAVLFVVDVIDGLCAADRDLTGQLRRLPKPVFLLVNKVDNNKPSLGVEFFELGLGEPYFISAAHGIGTSAMLEEILAHNAMDPNDVGPSVQVRRTRIAVIGKPNVGKSTLINRIIGEERTLVFDQPGTTRDSTDIPLDVAQRHYTLIDTAGVRRRLKIRDKIEKFSVVRALRAIESAQIVVFVIDAQAGISSQDASLLSYIADAGRALVITVNKSDLIGRTGKQNFLEQIAQWHFVFYAKVCFISALLDRGIGALWRSLDLAYDNARKQFPTPKLTQLLIQAVRAHPPPLVHGRRIKLRYAHQGGQNPLRIVVHGNQTQALPANYRRYLSHYFHKSLKLEGTPLQLVLKAGQNPYAGKKNTLTATQQRKRQRMLRHVKKK